ncbi:TfpX/TfpZ family type IV pilin accessory protein [Methyloradius palustris]|uniref:Pilus assembly protein n=1 Tax=Methyloradius palustris TaxID=2778876 RepID=A0A8D5G9M8_9PROT|nr:TfpX/TfpZ family type IV pilin accessory protein [Methyloradius palustris]BCM25626.1 hypothetical protein ZMTM_18850 [Methyloradius palustris]
MTRFRAAGIHLLISLTIVISILTLMLGLWYPGMYFKLMGGGGLLFIMSGVDVCLGPLLTLCVFKAGKKSLKFDLTVIGLFQAAALSYGLYVMFEARPVFTVFTNDQFQVASVVDIQPKELSLAKNPEWRSFPLTGPVVVAATAPTTQKDKDDVLAGALVGADWQQFPRLYVSYDSQWQNILAKAKPLSDLRAINKNNIPVVDSFLKSQARPESDFAFLPIRTSQAEMAFVIDAHTGDQIKIIDVVPWR